MKVKRKGLRIALACCLSLMMASGTILITAPAQAGSSAFINTPVQAAYADGGDIEVAKGIHDFREIPGITPEQINAVEKILAQHKTFIYGMTENSRAFYHEDGTLGGFNVLICDRLSELFGVPFELTIFTWNDLDAGVKDGSIDFSGDSTSFDYTGEGIRTNTIAERVMRTVRLKGALPLEYIESERPVRYAFVDGSTSQELLEDNGIAASTYEVVLVSNVEEAVEKLRAGEIDLFVAGSASADSLKINSDLVVDTYDPLTYKDINISTGNVAYQPIIDVINLYLNSGGMAELNEFYTAGYADFCQTTFIKSLTEEERIWYDQHVENNLPITIAISNSNYPVNFYNETSGQYEGIAIDVLDDIEEVSGLRFEIVNGPEDGWTTVLGMLQSGKASMTAELIWTEERAKEFIFAAEPYTTDRYVLISRSDTPNISSNQVMYAKVGLVENTGYSAMFQQWFPNNHDTITYPDIYEAFDALEDGQVDFVMATENRLLALTNYLERSGFKSNLIFDYSANSQFGYNSGYPILPGIIDKAQALVDTETIASGWQHMTFDYQKEMARNNMFFMLAIAIFLGAAIVMLILLLAFRRNNEKKLEALVAQRTEQLDEQILATEAASKAKSDFLSNMSHEMRTPINAVIGLSELTLTQDYSEEEARSNMEKIYSSGVTLLGLVNDILDLSKIESGKFELVPIEYDTPSIINDTVTLNIIRIGSKPIEFKLDASPDLPARLYGDELRVKQIFNNLLSNAFKYTREGTVEWAMRCERDPEDPDTVWLYAEVRDSGIGIKPENLDKVFGEYNQVDTKANRKVEGTGLGLTITKRMVEAMDGTISVSSVYGKGSTFTVKMRQKFVSDEVIGEKLVANLKSFNYADRKRDRNASFVRAYIPYARVLVVDDVTTNLDVARGLIKPYGMQVDTVTSGKACIELITKGEPVYNAIFMDHMMPEMDGIEATHIIKNDIDSDYARNIPVIALTANALVGNEDMFKNNGFQDFLSKPIDILRLDEIIDRWVRDREMEKMLAARGELDLDVAGNGTDQATYSGFFEGRHIPGVDIRSALATFGGDEECYINVLRSYVASSPELADKAEQRQDYTITVHGLKSASRNIGAATLGDLAEQLEKASKEDDSAFIGEHNERFVAKVRATVAQLEKLVAEYDATCDKEQLPRPDRETLAAMLEEAQSFDIDGLEEDLNKLEGFRYEHDEDLIPWLREQLDQAGFVRISERLERYLE
ncbi:MAG: transporter substrate-binding domain-containing protein [Coriobacteriales bacterium]|jgi:signal transduction histidine kinase/CheY-like chemotaxis protein/HPt (histidine-containing phosphotransfer) domain-containing protein|nr:transporter substrate-binding domain-containing protein [Coriobacteriales bacterium]